VALTFLKNYMNNNFVSVIIPSGRPDRVFLTVRSLLTQSVPSEMYEIIVVTPDPGELQRNFPEVRVIATDRLFPPGGMRNIGAQKARGRYLFFLDDDCMVPENFVEYLTQILRKKDQIGAVGCRVVAYDVTFWNRCADQALFTAYQAKKEGITAGLGSAALAVKRDAFVAVGGFDEGLMASEDWDFSLKLRESGWLGWFTPEIEVRHDHRRGNFSGILRAAWQYGRASGLTVQRRHKGEVSWVAGMMVAASRKRMYWLLMLPYSCCLTLVWLFDTRPIKMLPCLPVLFLARMSYQCGVFISLRDDFQNEIGEKNQEK